MESAFFYPLGEIVVSLFAQCRSNKMYISKVDKMPYIQGGDKIKIPPNVKLDEIIKGKK